MIEQNIKALQATLAGVLHGSDAAFVGVSTDSRSTQKHNLFIALQGDNFDGNRYVGAAHERGASAALVSELQDDTLPQLLVDDTLSAFQKMAKMHREGFEELTVIGLTGSNGKTGTKSMIAELFKAQHGKAAVLATKGNLNNHIGVPLTLSELGHQHHFAIVEMGANHPGEIDQLTQLAQPMIGLVTNAAAAHLEGFGSLEAVAETKGAVFRRLAPEGTAVINADDDFYQQWRESTKAKVISFGVADDADVRLLSSESLGNAQRITLSVPNGDKFSAELNLLGEHNALNATAAVAVGIAAGLTIEAMRKGLAEVRPVSGRLTPHLLSAGGRLIDDAYNANPASMRAAMNLLASSKGYRVMVVGVMAELGPDSDEQHAALGRYARQAGIEKLIAVGSLAAPATIAFGANGVAVQNWQQAMRLLEEHLSDATLQLLVKGSRAAGLDALVNALLEGGEAC